MYRFDVCESFACVCVYMPLLRAYLGRPEEEDIDLTELELQVVVGHHVGAETKLGSSAGTRLLNHQASL